MFFIGTDKINENTIEKYILEKENFSDFKLSLILKKGQILSKNQILNIFDEIKDLDNFYLNLEIKDGQLSMGNYTISDKNLTHNDELNIENLYNEMESEDSLKITLNIKKNSPIIKIYCYDFFIKSLQKLKLSEVLNYLSREFQNKEKKFLLSEGNCGAFNCRLFEICTDPTSLHSSESLSVFEREEIIKKRDTYTNQNNLHEYDFVPSDFHNTIDNNDTELAKFFAKLKIFLSVCFISNISKIDSNDLDKFEISILQQRSLILNTNFSDLVVDNASALYDVYKWIYEEKFTSEKLYHARAIISKDLVEGHNTWILPENSLASCQTTHSIYLKENVEKYLETKGRVAELIAEITVKNRESIVYITNSFKNNNATLLTYFISLFIFNSLSSNNFEIFNKSNYVLTLLFLGISSGILYMTYRQVNIDIAASETHFESVKNIYADIFDPAELDSIFKSNYYNDSVKSVEKSFSDHKWFWICEIIIIFLVITVVTFFLEDLIDMWDNIVFLLK